MVLKTSNYPEHILLKPNRKILMKKELNGKSTRRVQQISGKSLNADSIQCISLFNNKFNAFFCNFLSLISYFFCLFS